MKRTIVASLLAAAFAAPAFAGDFTSQLVQPLTVKPQSGGIRNMGDETDTSWLYTPNAKPFFADSKANTSKPVARMGDMTDTSWQYLPNGKPAFESQAAAPSSYVQRDDENDLRWLYQAPTAGNFADPVRQHPHAGFEGGNATRGQSGE